MAYNSIVFGSIDSAIQEAAIVAYYFQLTGRLPNPGDPEFHINATIAYERVNSLIAIDRAAKANIIAFATGANLDYLADLVGLERLDESPSVTRIQFTLVTGHAQVVIPSGTLVSSTDGQGVYATNEDYTVPTGIDVVIVDATCTTDGSATNGYGIGSIVTIQNPQPYLQSATNLDVTAGGAEVESDESFRARWNIALEALSVAGPSGGYEFYAKSASTTIIDVKPIGPEEPGYGVYAGNVELRVLVDTGVPSQAILDAVLAACNPDTVRPMCDTPLVYAAELISYDLVVEITAFNGANTIALPALVQAAIQVYTTAQGNKIGSDIVEDALTANGKIDGVKKLSFTGFTDIDVDFRHFARLNSITCTVVATEAP